MDIQSLKNAFLKISNFCDIVGISTSSIIESLKNQSPNFEDSVQMLMAKEIGADVIVTRDTRHFKKSLQLEY